MLNVDRRRERCALAELNQAKLRRVAFCVDVEIAPMPKYADGDSKKICVPTCDKTVKRKISEKGEGEALKNPKALEDQKELNGVVKATGERLPKEPPREGIEQPAPASDIKDSGDATSEKLGDTKKKEKKKKSEEERKARKEKKRKLAEANGQIPMELHLDSDSSSPSTPTNGVTTPRTQALPTTNPVRIYRRCCQLRETPILKKITEQLTNSSNASPGGVVEKLDLTGYWMQLADLVTLGDYLAVVPIKEVVLENCGLTDEGLRVILAGLLAARRPEGKKRRSITEPDGFVHQGGVVERLVLKNNKIGPEGWKHLCLFLYMCRSLKALDVSNIAFPKPAATSHAQSGHGHQPNGTQTGLDLCKLLSKSIGDRLAGSCLELINLGETGLSTEQLGEIIDGIIRSGIRRLGLAHNNIDNKGLEHIQKYLRSGKCEGLDLGGNDLRDRLEVVANALDDENPLFALSLAECNLKPGSLCKLLPKLIRLQNFRFIDLSHNHDLFKSEPSAVGVLRRYLPKLAHLKRIHLTDVGLNSDQAIALAEILPEMPSLAHISLLENPELTRLADAKTEETQEEASALYASFLAATRVSESLVAVDIDVPTEAAGEIVRALAKQVVAYCLRNMERLPLGNAVAALSEASATTTGTEPVVPDVLQHLVGKDALLPDTPEEEEDVAPDDDYVIGGTGVAKALACCLNNRGDESRRQSGEFIREVETGIPVERPHLPSGKAKDVSKHLLVSARKIRHRLQPALVKAKTSSADTNTYYRLLFLQNTLDGIIKRFEDEYPETRESFDSAISVSLPDGHKLGTSLSSAEGEPDAPAAISDAEDEVEISREPLKRSNSTISLTSKALVNEEARVLRAGHKFRASWLKPQHYDVLFSGVEEIGADPNHVRVLHEMIDDLGDEDLLKKVEEKGAIRVYMEDKEQVLRALKEADPEHWDRFIESQRKARANVQPGQPKPPAENGQAAATTVEDIAVTD